MVKFPRHMWEEVQEVPVGRFIQSIHSRTSIAVWVQARIMYCLLNSLHETYQDQEHAEYYIRNKSITIKGSVLLTWIDGHIDVS